MRSSSRVVALALAVAVTSVRAAVYDLLRVHQGNSFFDGFTWKGTYNFTINQPTWDSWDSGDNWFANETYSMATNLTAILPNGNALLKVDDVTPGLTLYNDFMDKRYSVRIDSEEFYGTGNVIIADIVHLPWGCSVWPAFWLSGNDGTFPQGGEIDIVENVNMATNNQINIHADGVCTVPPNAPNLATYANCGDAAGANFGCSFTDTALADFGDNFNNAGGGMWITEFSSDGINVWFFGRSGIPQALSTAANSSSIDTSTLGTPIASVVSTPNNCNFTTLFNPMKLVISIALCGDFAAAPPVFIKTCPLTGNLTAAETCYQTFVAGPNSNFTDAYFEIASVRVFNDGSPSSYGTNQSTVRIASPGQGGTTSGMPASAPGGTSTSDSIVVSTSSTNSGASTSTITSSASSGSKGGGGKGGGGGTGGTGIVNNNGDAASPHAASAVLALLLAAAAGVRMLL